MRVDKSTLMWYNKTRKNKKKEKEIKKMEFVIYKASDDKFKEVRTINTLDELMAFSDEVMAELIIGGEDFDESGRKSIMIYDDYLE